MEAVKDWVVGVCAAAMVCTLLDLLLPRGKTEKAAKLVTAMFFLCAMLVPVASGWKELDWEDVTEAGGEGLSMEELEKKVGEQVLEVSGRSMEESVAKALRESGIEAEKISVRMHIDREGYISMERTDIFLTEKDAGRKEEVRKKIEAFTGATVNVFA